jgi:hypothetical protein
MNHYLDMKPLWQRLIAPPICDIKFINLSINAIYPSDSTRTLMELSFLRLLPTAFYVAKEHVNRESHCS